MQGIRGMALRRVKIYCGGVIRINKSSAAYSI